MFRIFTKPQGQHDWIKASEHTSLNEALAVIDNLTHDHRAKPGRWVVRDIKGVEVARVTVAPLPQPSTFWTLQQVQVC